MPVIDRVEVSDELLRELELTAAARGITIAELAAARIEDSVRRQIEQEKAGADNDAPPSQTT